jgi:hypothetical protein
MVPYSAIASATFSPSTWPMHRLLIPPAHARHSSEIFSCEASKYQFQSNARKKTELTSSTTLTDPKHCPAPPDNPGSLRCFHRSVLSRLRCHFYRIPMKRTVQSEAVGHLFSGELVKC